MLDTRGPSATQDVPPRPERTPTWPTRLAPTLPALVMLVLGLWGLGRDDAMGNDEVATRWVSSLSLPAMRHVLSHLDAVHGLYYVVIHFWGVFGRSPTAIRVPSLIATVLAVAVVTVLARRLTGSMRAGVAAGLVAVATTGVSYYAQTARSYTMVYLVMALATLLLVRALDPSTGSAFVRAWLPYGLLIVLGGYLNELSLLVLGAHLITVLCARRGWGTTARWAGVSVVAVALVAPLIRLSRRQSMVLDYLRPPGGKNVWSLFHLMFGGTTVAAVLVAVIAAVGVVSRFPATGAARLSPATVGLPLLVVPAALLMVYSEIASPLYADRYVLFGEIGAAVLAGAGVDALVRRLPSSPGPVMRAAGASVVVLACVAVFVAQLGPQQDARRPSSRQFDFGGPSAFVGQRARPGDGVLFFNRFYRKARLGYPDDFRDTTDLAQLASPERTASFLGRDLPLPTIRARILDYDRIWVVGRPPGSIGAGLPGVRAQALELQRHFVKVAGVRYGQVTATLWRRD